MTDIGSRLGPDLRRSIFWATGLILVLMLLSLVRPVDHDESQYVAAASLTARGLLPYRDYAYLQTPLQPLLFAPLAWIAGVWAWPLLRIANALLGALAIAGVWRAARIGGADARAATLAAGLFATCDILLFSIGTARNDALPVAALALALPAILRTANGDARPRDAVAIGALLAAAAAAKISYALPALAYGGWTLLDPSARRPVWTLAGAAPLALVVLALAAIAPQGFVFGVFDFPAHAPAQWYADRPWKLSLAAKGVDTLKFLALGPALLAILVVARAGWRRAPVLGLLVIAGLVAALLPVPTWRQYLLPMLPPLFVALALAWRGRPPGRAIRIAAIVFAIAGLAPSLVALGGALLTGLPMADAMRRSAAIRVALDRERVTGPIATLSPQFLPATGRTVAPAFATGPFYYRASDLIGVGEERALGLAAHARPVTIGTPQAILIGGEGAWTGGTDSVDAWLAAAAVAKGYRRVAVPGGRFTLYLRPSASPPPANRNTP